jgi:hypothetical protein
LRGRRRKARRGRCRSASSRSSEPRSGGRSGTFPRRAGNGNSCGIGFGIIVWFVNLLVLVAANRFAPTFFGLDRDLIAYIGFFGLPLAFVASRLLRDP